VRKFDELIAGLTATTTAVATAMTPGVAVDRDACFCQGKRLIFLSFWVTTHRRSVIIVLIIVF
jgi:hypothetical protein